MNAWDISKFISVENTYYHIFIVASILVFAVCILDWFLRVLNMFSILFLAKILLLVAMKLLFDLLQGLVSLVLSWSLLLLIVIGVLLLLRGNLFRVFFLLIIFIFFILLSIFLSLFLLIIFIWCLRNHLLFLSRLRWSLIVNNHVLGRKNCSAFVKLCLKEGMEVWPLKNLPHFSLWVFEKYKLIWILRVLIQHILNLL